MYIAFPSKIFLSSSFSVYSVQFTSHVHSSMHIPCTHAVLEVLRRCILPCKKDRACCNCTGRVAQKASYPLYWTGCAGVFVHTHIVRCIGSVAQAYCAYDPCHWKCCPGAFVHTHIVPMGILFKLMKSCYIIRRRPSPTSRPVHQAKHVTLTSASAPQVSTSTAPYTSAPLL